MTLSIRQRWMLYGLAGLGTAAAMWAVGPEPASDTVAPVVRAARAPVRSDAPSTAMPALAPLAARPFGGAGRSPFGEAPVRAPAEVQAAAIAAAAQAAQVARGAKPAPPPAPVAPPLPFTFLGRWVEGGVNTVFVASGGRSLPAVEGQPLTPVYLVERIAERELQLRHLPTGQRQTLALVAGGPVAATAAAVAAPQNPADTEEQN